MIDNLQLKGNENLLDIATGTGHVAIAAALKLRNGKVTGIDISEKMQHKAVNKANEFNLRNAIFKHCDIEDMDFDHNAFDAACLAVFPKKR